MKLNFLGTCDGAPSKDCDYTSTLLTVGNTSYLFDVGAPVTRKLLELGVSPASVRGVFVTHPHSDHLLGLFGLVDACTSIYRNSKLNVFLPEPKLIDIFANVNMYLYGGNYDRVFFHSYEEGEIFDDGNIKVTAIRVQHMDNAYAFMVEAEDKKIIFSGDLKRPDIDFPQLAYENKIDAVVLESAHFQADYSEPVLDKVNPRVVIFNHINTATLGTLNALCEKEKPYKRIISFDGFELEI